MSGEFVETSPLQTKMFGEISTEDEPLPVFICTWRPNGMTFYSEDMPEKCGYTKDFYYFRQEYTLLDGDIYLINTKHFTFEVGISNIGEIPAGTVLDFYRSDAK